MTNKRIIALLLVFLLIFSAACKGNPTVSDNTQTENTEENIKKIEDEKEDSSKYTDSVLDNPSFDISEDSNEKDNEKIDENLGEKGNFNNTSEDSSNDSPAENVEEPVTEEIPDTKVTSLKLGATGPLSGDYINYGTSVKNGFELAISQINQLGGIQLELNMIDDKSNYSDETLIKPYYNELKEWGMDIMLGSVMTGTSTITSKYAKDDNCFFFSATATGDDVIKSKDNAFRMCVTDSGQGSDAAKYIADNNLGQNVGVIFDSSINYSSSNAKSFKSKAKELGLNVVDGTDIAKLQENGAEVVFVPGYAEFVANTIKTAREYGYNPIWICIDGADSLPVYIPPETCVNETILGVNIYTDNDPSGLNKEFVSAYKKAYGKSPDIFAAEAYDAVYALWQAINNVEIMESMNRSQICELLKSQFTSMTFNGVTGSDITWSKTGEISRKANAVIYKDGVFSNVKQ